ncbi:MAG TPA: dienelactone hydrolase family protein [Kofleriaceae bacterium]|nr:dienelactone hydrolase family protein [Kofleriaceae bacterium]
MSTAVLAHRHLVAALIVAVGCSGSARPSAPVAPDNLVYTTYTVGGDAPTGLLVALHYSSSTPAFWDDLVKNRGTPVRVLFPQGPFPKRGGFTWFPAEHEQKETAAKLADVEQMAARVAHLIEGIRAAHPEIQRVAVTGFSYGGDLAWLLAVRYPELVDAAVPMGSRLLGDSLRPLPATLRVRVLQGETDAIIDARATTARVAELQARGVPVELTIYPGLGHDLSAALIADWRTYLHAALD